MKRNKRNNRSFGDDVTNGISVSPSKQKQPHSQKVKITPTNLDDSAIVIDDNATKVNRLKNRRDKRQKFLTPSQQKR